MKFCLHTAAYTEIETERVDWHKGRNGNGKNHFK